MPKGVEFEADEDSDSTCDSESILMTSPVFPRAPMNRRFTFTLDHSDSDPDVIGETPQPKRLRTGISTKHMNHQQVKSSGTESWENEKNSKAKYTKQQVRGGSINKSPPAVIVSSSDCNSDQDDEWLPKSTSLAASKKSSPKCKLSERFSIEKFVKSADEDNHDCKRVTPKLIKQRTFVVPDPNVPPLPTLSPREKSLQKLAEIRKRKESQTKRATATATATAASVNEKGADVNGSPSKFKRIYVLGTDSESSDGEFFGALHVPKVKGGRIKSKSPNHRKKDPLPKRGMDMSAEQKNSTVHKQKKSVAVSIVTLPDSESSTDISEDEFERIVDKMNRGRTRNSPGASVAAASASAPNDCINISEDSTNRRSRNRMSSPDMSEDELNDIVISRHRQRERRLRNLPGTLDVAASASATSEDSTDISEITRRRRSRNRSSSLGRNGFVPASTLLKASSQCSPPRPCRRSCPSKDDFTQSTVSSETRQSSPKTSLNRPDRPSANRWQQHTSVSDDDTIVNSVRAVTQMEKDEEMARRLQEDMDRQYAAALASGAATTPQSQRQPGSLLPPTIALDTAEEMEARINMLTDWQWQVHVSIVQGSDVPPPDAEQSPDEALDPALLEYLYSHPEAIDLRRTTNNRRATRSRIIGIPPVILPEQGNLPRPPRNGTRRRRGGAAAARRRRNGGFGIDLPDEMFNDSLLDGMMFNDAQAFFEELSADIRTRRGGRNILDRIPRFGRGLNTTIADGNDYEELLALEEQLGAVVTRVGLSAEQISRLPLTTFQTATASADATQCHVCMCDYEEGDRLRLLTCFHSFHCDCIDKWIKDNPTCPVCRIEVKV